MQFGHFDDQKREYVIERPDTPLPWINYLGSQEFFSLISNTGGGYSFYKDARLRRLTRYRYNNAPLDNNGRYIYLRDDEDGSAWSPTWQPMRRDLDQYTCRHGMGYSIINSQYRHIEAETRFFVPLGDNLEVWQLTVTNHRDKAARLSAYAAVEFCLWDAWDDATNFQRNFSTGEVEVADGVIFHKTEYRERRNHFAYFSCAAATSGFDTDRQSFLGAYRGWDDPQVVAKGISNNSIASGWQPIGAHHLQIKLQPGEQKTITFLLGYHENPVDDKFDPPGTQIINKRLVKATIAKYSDPSETEAAFQALREYWDELLNKFTVNTPDEHTNRMINIWNTYQVMVTFNLSRSASYFESGIGRGMGFRDSNQDLLGFVHLIPERARQRILDLAATQLPNGGAYHQYQPLTKRGNNDIGSEFNDDPLWLVLAVAAYIKESGDWTILEESVPYDNDPDQSAPLYNHLERSLQYTLDRMGPHQLPLIGRADWNDCLNLNCFSETPGQPFQTTTNKEGRVAESVFIAGLFILAAREMVEITTRHKSKKDASRYEQAIVKMTEAVESAGWDGEWFRRAYDDFGNPVGSMENDEGQIFIEPQGMCVMAGVGLDNGIAQKALDSVADKLATQHGIVVLQPAYTYYRLHLGEISTYPPGYKENASVFSHANPWVIIAETITGNGDRAFDYYTRINPSARHNISDVHRCEPYVYAQMIAGKDAPNFGEAKNSWLTGSAAWNLVAVTQHIMGIRPTYDGLEINPVIPRNWPGFEATRVFRGKPYHFKIERDRNTKTLKIMVNGNILEGNFLPV